LERESPRLFSRRLRSGVGSEVCELMRASRVLLLSATETWERFTYYGMRALLVLFLVAPPEHGGIGFADQDAAAIYGLFVAAVYLSALPGGWIADQIVGPVLAVWIGGAFILAGNILLGLTRQFIPFAIGLGAIAVGVGLLKPSVTTLVGRTAKEDGQPVDAVFTTFYIGINIGAILGPLISAALATRFGWHVGFLAAAVGMVLGLFAFATIVSRLPKLQVKRTVSSLHVTIAFAAGVIAVITLVSAVRPAQLVRLMFLVVLLASIWAFIMLFRAASDESETRNVRTLVALFCGGTVFFAAAEQSGASLTLFAERFTDRVLLGHAFPSAWYQSLYPFCVVALAPFFVWLWKSLESRQLEPAIIQKFAGGLAFGAIGIGTAAVAAATCTRGMADSRWLIGTYLLLAIGELMISPIGLAAAARLSPASRSGFATGLWFLTVSLGGLIAGLTGGYFDLGSAAGLSTTFGSVAAVLAGTCLGLLAVDQLWRRRSM